MFNMLSFFENNFETFQVQKKIAGVDSDYIDSNSLLIAGDIKVDVQELDAKEALMYGEAGLYTKKIAKGYTDASNFSILTEGDMLLDVNNRNKKRYEIINIINKKDYLLLYLQQEVV